MSSTGSNQITDIFNPRGTMRLTPLSGVKDGGGVVTATAAAGVVTLAATASKVLLDALPFSVAAGSAVTAALPDGVHKLKLFINPVRKVLAVSTLPGTGTIGQEVMLVTRAGDFEDYLQDIYTYTASGWLVRDAAIAANLDPNGPYIPQTWEVPTSSNFRHVAFNDIVGTSYSVADERQIIWAPQRGQLASLPSIEGSYARYSAGFAVAEVRVKLTAGAIAVPATDVTITRTKSVDLI